MTAADPRPLTERARPFTFDESDCHPAPPLTVYQALTVERFNAAPDALARCCGLHIDGDQHDNGMAACCDLADCVPCCEDCPTCPSVAAVDHA